MIQKFCAAVELFLASIGITFSNKVSLITSKFCLKSLFSDFLFTIILIIALNEKCSISMMWISDVTEKTLIAHMKWNQLNQRLKNYNVEHSLITHSLCTWDFMSVHTWRHSKVKRCLIRCFTVRYLYTRTLVSYTAVVLYRTFTFNFLPICNASWIIRHLCGHDK